MDQMNQEKKEPAAEEVSANQLEDAAGAGLSTRFRCMAGNHGFMLETLQEKRSGSVIYEKKRCKECGAIVYRKDYFQNISESEFNAVPD